MPNKKTQNKEIYPAIFIEGEHGVRFISVLSCLIEESNCFDNHLKTRAKNIRSRNNLYDDGVISRPIEKTINYLIKKKKKLNEGIKSPKELILIRDSRDDFGKDTISQPDIVRLKRVCTFIPTGRDIFCLICFILDIKCDKKDCKKAFYNSNYKNSEAPNAGILFNKVEQKFSELGLEKIFQRISNNKTQEESQSLILIFQHVFGINVDDYISKDKSLKLVSF